MSELAQVIRVSFEGMAVPSHYQLWNIAAFTESSTNMNLIDLYLHLDVLISYR